MEPRLWSCILKMAVFWGEGILMDAGANDGRSSLKMAQKFQNRSVWSVEPIQANVASISKMLANFENVKILHGGLGASRGVGSYPDFLDKRRAGAHNQIGQLKNYKKLMSSNASKSFYPIYTVDELLGEEHRLAFAHWDVEGNEENLLKGAKKIIRRDRPIFSLETFPKTDPSRHQNLSRETTSLGYSCTEIDEVCGRPTDCRNMLCIPDERKDLMGRRLAQNCKVKKQTQNISFTT